MYSGNRPYYAVADLEGDRAGSAPPLGRRTDAVTVLLISENGTVLWRVINFDRSVVKRALQNTQNDCHPWLSDCFRVQCTKFVFSQCSAPGAPDPAEEFTSFPNLPTWFKGPTSKGKGREGKRKGRDKETEGKGREEKEGDG